MSLPSGKRLGPYEILAPLGAGGMGEVYRARDTRLDRTVAIKVLPAHLSSDPELRQRFEREARAVSSLSHPHICALHDIGTQDGIDYMVLEYLEGETLAARLERGPLPTPQLLRVATEICDALDKAHRQGVVHRDLKPGNIMLAKSGAKLLDFGLAKPLVTENAALPTLATQSQPLTTQGTLLGTFQYMAPEQLEGKQADARSDIFALGAVLYEMATGKKAFAGKTQASVIAAVLEREPPPLTALQPLAPPALERVITTCLAKDPDERWQTAHDVKLQLQWIADAGSQAGVPAPVVARRKGRERLAWAAAAVLLLAAVALAVLYFHRPAPQVRVTRFVIPPPEKSIYTGSLAVSPDGRSLAFTATGPSGKDRLWVRPLDSLTAKDLPETDDAAYPFWSPDSHSVGFFAQGKLQTIAVSGGPPHSLCEVSDARGGAWNGEGKILFAPSSSSALYIVSASGGSPTPITTLEQSQETSHRWPVFLPDGRHFLYFIQSGKADVQGIYLGSLDAQEKKRILGTGSYAAYAPPGNLLFVRGRTLMVQAFDARRAQLSGDPVPLVESIWSDEMINGLTAFSVSENGVLAYRSSTAANSHLVWFDRTGKPLGTVGPPGMYNEPALSPNGKQVAADVGLDIWLIDLSTQISSRFTFGSGSGPSWSPDGSRIIFAANPQGNYDLYQKLSNNAGHEELVVRSDIAKYPDDWSRDGRYVVYENLDPKTRFDLWVVPFFGDRKPTPFLQTPFNEMEGHFSPDGRWMAYASDESGRYEVYVRSFPSGEGKWQVSNNGGAQPSWSQDGKELFYMAADKKLMAVKVKTDGPSFEAGPPIALFATHVPSLTDARNYYVVSNDGKRILVVTPAEEAVSTPTCVVLNWPATLSH